MALRCGVVGIGQTEYTASRVDVSMAGLLREAAEYCQQVKDFTSGQLFEKILRNEEEHVDFLEKQFDMIVRMGEQNYIQLQSAAAGEDGNEGGAWGLGGGDGNGN